MKTITVTKTVCTFEELSPEHQEKALEYYRDCDTSDSFWYECVIDDAKGIAALMGIDIDHVYFRGFWSQGDGACFVGSFSYQAGMVKAVKEHAPQDKELHAIAKQIQELHRMAFYSASGKVSHYGHYYHERSMSVDVVCDQGRVREEEWKDTFADVARWIYKRLEADYDYLNSDTQVREGIIANEIEFTIGENGELEF